MMKYIVDDGKRGKIEVIVEEHKVMGD